jgi:hypothetical protein
LDKDYARAVVNAAETGKTTSDYKYITTLADGPGGKVQLTLGVGYTEYGGSSGGSGNLKTVFERYLNDPSGDSGNKGQLINVLQSRGVTLQQDSNGKSILSGFAPSSGASLIANPDGSKNDAAVASFQTVFNTISSDNAFKSAQEFVFSNNYENKAFAFENKNGIKSPLGHVIMLDTYVHSHSYGPKTFGYNASIANLNELKTANQNLEEAMVNPSSTQQMIDNLESIRAAKEKTFLDNYTQARSTGLSSSSNTALQNSAYRAANYNAEVNRDNMELYNNMTVRTNSTSKTVIVKSDDMLNVNTKLIVEPTVSVPNYSPPKVIPVAP